MVKNIIIGILVLIIVGETGVLAVEKVKSHVQEEAMEYVQKAKPTVSPAGPNARGGKQIMLGKGSNLKTSPIMQYAFQIAPGALSASAKKAMVGWSISSQAGADGSTVVTLTPKDSDDQSQVYTINQGQTLYFIEQTPLDDKNDQDKDLNYRDDYGIITDANGIIQ